jgi:hypothetical protein
VTADLEEELRAALAAKADTFTVSPDAWQRTQRRRATRSPARRWAAPLAVAAATMTVATTALLMSGGRPATPPTTTPRTPARPPQATPSAPPRFLLTTDPPLGKIARMASPYGPGRTAFFWAGWGVVDSAHRKAKTVCDSTVAGMAQGGGCEEYRPLPPTTIAAMDGGDRWLAREADPRFDRDPAAYYPSNFGQAQAQVDKVTVVLPDGRRLPGAITSVEHLSDKFWWVVLPPERLTHVTILFADAKGRQLAALHETLIYVK